MPAPGEQHKTVGNPFEEAIPRMSEYTAQEIATLQSRLEKQLGPEYISSRPGASGQRVHYIAAEKCINLANEVFGFNGWSSTIKEIQVDFVDENTSTGKISLGLSVIVRVTLKDGTSHEDIGYGHIENCKGKAAAFEKAKKEGTTDAMKRALRNFGNVLGNCIYDKEYLSKVTKLKVAPVKWGIENLHRHADYAPVKKEPHTDTDSMTTSGDSNNSGVTAECDDEFGTTDFDEADFSVANIGHPDEISLETSITNAQPSITKSSANTAQPHFNNINTAQSRSPAIARGQVVPSIPANGSGNSTRVRPALQQPTGGLANANPMMNRPSPQQPMAGSSNDKVNGPTFKSTILPQQSHGFHNGQPQSVPRGPLPNPQQPTGPGFSPGARRQGPPLTVQRGETPSVGVSNENDPPVGFFTARVAETLQNSNAIPSDIPAFNPHLESPSIRKTAGVDHTKTGPIAKEFATGAPLGNTSMPPRPGFSNPAADQARRIGMPKPAMASPLQNRGSYKPPQMMKRPADGSVAPYPRPALNDVTSATVNVPQELGTDLKRQRLDNGNGNVGGANSITS